MPCQVSPRNPKVSREFQLPGPLETRHDNSIRNSAFRMDQSLPLQRL